MFVLALPLSAGSDLLTIAAFVGGLSAATAMVIVESVALAIMVSNDIVVPLVLQRRETLDHRRASDVGALLLTVRRVAIFVILLFAYLYYRLAGEAQLASIGLLSFAAVAQLAPAFFGGLIWRRATARGAIAGMTVGILVWAYTLLLPSFADAGIVGHSILSQGPWGIALLRPQALFGLDLPPLAHGVVWSLALNVLAYVGFSLGRRAGIDRAAAGRPVRARRPRADRAELPAVALVGDGRGADHDGRPLSRRGAHAHLVRELRRSPAASASSPKSEADFQLLRYAEHLLASAIGAASSRLVLSLLLRKRTVSTKAALKLLDDANAAIHYNREILQTALDHVRQGIAVFDKDLHLVCWNRQFGEILDLPPELDPHRHRARRDPALQRRARRSRPRRGRRARARAARPLRRRAPSRSSSASPSATWSSKCAPTACPTAASSRLHRHHAEREGGGSARARQRIAGAARARAHRGTDPAQHRARPRQGGGRARPTSPRPASSPPRATTSCSRSMPRGSMSPAWSSGRATATMRSSSAISMPRSTRSRRSSARCSTSRGSTPAP